MALRLLSVPTKALHFMLQAVIELSFFQAVTFSYKIVKRCVKTAGETEKLLFLNSLIKIKKKP
jgi:hypothetical protein